MKKNSTEKEIYIKDTLNTHDEYGKPKSPESRYMDKFTLVLR